MNTQSIALAVIAGASAGIGFAYVGHLVRSGFGLLLAPRTAATSRTQSCGMKKVVMKCEMCSSGELQPEQR